jgi:hypothetical protein
MSVLTKPVGERPSTALSHSPVVVRTRIHRNPVTFAVPRPKRFLACRGARRMSPGSTPDHRSSQRQVPDRLTRTSGDFVIVEVRPPGEHARSSCSAPGGFPLRYLTPLGPGGSRLIIERRCGVVRGDNRRGDAPLPGRDGPCVLPRPPAPLRATGQRSYSCRVFRRTTALYP